MGNYASCEKWENLYSLLLLGQFLVAHFAAAK
jgi:hypothetical protein